jgi:hypothetical protein
VEFNPGLTPLNLAHRINGYQDRINGYQGNIILALAVGTGNDSIFAE